MHKFIVMASNSPGFSALKDSMVAPPEYKAISHNRKERLATRPKKVQGGYRDVRAEGARMTRLRV